MDDRQKLDKLRQLVEFAKHDAADSQERLEVITVEHNERMKVLERAKERYLAHLEMIATTVKA